MIYALERTSAIVHACGSCFRIYNHAPFSVWITAAHVLEWALKLTAPVHLKNRHVSEWRAEDIEKAKKRIFLWMPDLINGPLPALVSFGVSPSLDLASVVVEYPRWKGPGGPRALPIDSDFYPVGTKVVAAVPTEIAPVTSEGTPREFKIDVGTELRRGEITNYLRRGRLVPAPLFETSIPIRPGMSGAPILLAPEVAPGLLRVIGVVSHDLSPEDVQAAPGGVGLSSIIPIALAYSLNIGLKLTDCGPGFPSYCERGAIHDFGTRKSAIRLKRDGRDFSLSVPPFPK